LETQSIKPAIYFSFFMFTADLKPADKSYTKILISHLAALSEIGYDGFDMHIAPPDDTLDFKQDKKNYESLKSDFDNAGFADKRFTTNVGTTQLLFDPTSPDAKERTQALAYLKSRVDITAILGNRDSIMSGPFIYPYGAFPLDGSGQGIWSDALLAWMKQRYIAARPVFAELAEYAYKTGVKLAIEPVKSWETPPPNMVSEVLDFIESVKTDFPIGATVDTAQVVMESQGPSAFFNNVDRMTAKKNFYYVHVSAPDRGAVHDSWIPWKIMFDKFEPVFKGPYLIEIFNAIPPFESSMRMARKRFWRPGEDKKGPEDLNAYYIAEAALKEIKDHLSFFNH